MCLRGQGMARGGHGAWEALARREPQGKQNALRLSQGTGRAAAFSRNDFIPPSFCFLPPPPCLPVSQTGEGHSWESPPPSALLTPSVVPARRPPPATRGTQEAGVEVRLSGCWLRAKASLCPDSGQSWI